MAILQAVPDSVLWLQAHEIAKNNFESTNVQLHTLTNFTSFVKTALKKKYISKEQLDHIMDWKKHPEGWVSV